ncbi:sensor histidine kinase [Pelagibaculum spongiae]|uniref:histidine kinase n=1 Tax=Pelagibaculum spongiae TaxID=2080658 RepID=A0A2V1GY06_9GAMM|nr:sensor histidine kinase [Pelagibaculum spongiae]PVZ66422.1 sensor histidine kinase [Pelagibaculum spongiae]
MQLVLELLQQLSVYLVIAWLLSKTPLFRPLVSVNVQLPRKLVVYLVFSGFCIMGTYFGLQIEDAIANTRAIGAVLGGLLGGPVVGFAVGLTGGLHRMSLGGFTAEACAISTTLEGLIGGWLHWQLVRKGRTDLLFRPEVTFGVVLYAELVQMAVILIFAKPFDEAWRLVQLIALPMIIANSIGAAMFTAMIRDRQTLYEQFTRTFSSSALRIAERTVGILASSFDEQSTRKVAEIVREETGVAAVAITDREKLLAFIGKGDDHHQPGTLIASEQTREAIDKNQVVFADGIEKQYRCSLSDQCPLGSALIIPLCASEDEVIGTIKLYETKNQLFSRLNKTLGEGVARLLSNQILYGRVHQQQDLLMQAELKLIQAQINPHFLFNALNTISAITRKSPGQARTLLQHLSTFFRKNLKRRSDESNLLEELDHIQAYLEIEKARFGDRLQVEFDIDHQLDQLKLPTFTLQPLVENAIKHGVSTLLETGKVIIRARRCENKICLEVEDNAGTYITPKEEGSGLGMNIVDKRLKARFGEQFGVKILVESDVFTRVTIMIPHDLMSGENDEQ